MTATRWTKNRIFATGAAPQSTSITNNHFLGGPTSPPPQLTSPIALASLDKSHYYAKPTIELSSHDGTILIAYPSVAQLWEFSSQVSTGGAYCLTGSTFGVNGKIISAHFINYKAGIQEDLERSENGDSFEESSGEDEDSNNESPSPGGAHTSKHNSPNLVLLQVVRRDDIHLEVHQLNKKPSFVRTLVLPPMSSGPGPYTIYARHTEKCIAIITKVGAVTLFSVPEFHPLQLSGLETTLNQDGMPLFDLCGRWLVYSPAQTPTQTVYTPFKLPPPGLLLDRILENISTTTAASLKSLSDAGVAGFRHYLAKDSSNPTPQAIKYNQAKRTGNNVIYVGSRKFDVDSSGRVGSSGSPISSMSALPAALTSLFSTQSKSQSIQVIDLETQSVVSTFLSPQGLSFMSLSPYDTVLATVSAKGESVFTFDLSFVPRQVSLSGKYVRGKTPGKVSHVEWDTDGGFGIVTHEKGSVHWFGRQPWNTYESHVDSVSTSVSGQHPGVIPNSSKIWRLSGWNVSDMCIIPETIGSEAESKNSREIPSEHSLAPKRESSLSSLSSAPSMTEKKISKYSNVAMLRDGEIIVVNVATGMCSWKYDLPSLPIAETVLARTLIITDRKDSDIPLPSNAQPKPQFRNLEDLQTVEPLSFYEMETCLPYPFVHTDRHVILATYDEEEEKERIMSNVFGLTVKAKELDFGRARGLVNFSGDSITPSDSDLDGPEDYERLREGDGPALKADIPWEKAAELQHAMESMVIGPQDDYL